MSPAEIQALVFALGGAVASILTAWALVIRARKGTGRVATLLQRVIDWADLRIVIDADVGKRIVDLLPARLAAEVDATLKDKEPDET